MRVFRKFGLLAVKIHNQISHILMTGVEYTILSVCLIGLSLAAFASPIGIYRLLKSVVRVCGCDFLIHYFPSYLETGGADTYIRPWFWIFWLFGGPTIRNICYQWYIFIATRTLVRTEGLLTQLIFEHSLRIRLKAEASNEKFEDDNLTVIGTQDSESVTEGTSVDFNSLTGETASQSSQASTPISRNSSSDSQSTSNDPVKSKDSSTLKSDTKSAAKDEKEAQNLIGKINNLVTTDLGNIVEGRDFLMISMLQFFV